MVWEAFTVLLVEFRFLSDTIEMYSMKKIIAFLLFSLFLVLPQSVLAQGKAITLPSTETVKGPYFVAGELITISGTVDGDVYVAGETVIVDGTVNGDLLVVGGTVEIKGQVAEDVRVAGGTVTIKGNVGGSVTAGTGQFILEDEGAIGRSIVVGTGNLMLDGPVNGDVYAGVGDFTLMSNAQVNGNLNYASSKRAKIADGAVVAGTVNFKQTEQPQQQRRKASRVFSNAFMIGKLVSLSILFIIGFAFLRLFPVFTKQTVSIAKISPWKDMGVGLLILFMTPIIAVLLAVTIVGIPFALVLLFAYMILLYIAKIFIAIYLGNRVLKYVSKNKSEGLALFVGLIVQLFVTLVPFVGWFAGFVFMVWGTGAYIISKRQSYRALYKKNLI